MSKFKLCELYMHKDARDVFIQVLNRSYIGPNYIKLKVMYYNLGYEGKPWALVRVNEFKVMKEQYDNWVWLDVKDVYTPRTKAGLP